MLKHSVLTGKKEIYVDRNLVFENKESVRQA